MMVAPRAASDDERKEAERKAEAFDEQVRLYGSPEAAGLAALRAEDVWKDVLMVADAAAALRAENVWKAALEDIEDASTEPNHAPETSLGEINRRASAAMKGKERKMDKNEAWELLLERWRYRWLRDMPGRARAEDELRAIFYTVEAALSDTLALLERLYGISPEAKVYLPASTGELIVKWNRGPIEFEFWNSNTQQWELLSRDEARALLAGED